MKSSTGRLLGLLVVLAAGTFAFSQIPPDGIAVQQEPGGYRLPNGKLQRDEILKAEHEQNVKDADHLVELAGQLKEEIEKNDRFVLSVSTLKKTDEIEKLVKKIRTRLRH